VLKQKRQHAARSNKMPAPRGFDHWWDRPTWNPFGGCFLASPGCTNCYAAQEAGTKTWPYARSARVHDGVTIEIGTRRIFNGKLTAAPEGHHLWNWPLKWRGAKHPKLGAGQPSLIFVGDMSDLFHEDRDAEVINHVCSTIAISDHIGLLVTKRTARMADYFTKQSPRTVERWQPKMWLGFSAERQQEFDIRWSDVRTLANAGWFTFVSIAPMIAPVTLCDDFLALGKRTWVIVAGEQGPHARCRDMDPQWARAIRDQCAVAGIPFFMKQMAKREAIPPDLHIRQFPLLPT
jgi:protein gp37